MLAIRLLTITVLSLPKRLKLITGFLRIINFVILPDKNAAIKRSGITIPNTYIPPIANAPKKLGERNVSVKMPIKTGAQHALVMPEKMPSVNTDTISVFPLPCPGRRGIGNLIPRNVITEATTITKPPK